MVGHTHIEDTNNANRSTIEYGVSNGSYIVSQTDFTLLFAILSPSHDHISLPTLTLKQVNCESYNSWLNVPHYLPGNYHVLLDALCITIPWQFNGNYTTVYIMLRIYIYINPVHNVGVQFISTMNLFLALCSATI